MAIVETLYGGSREIGRLMDQGFSYKGAKALFEYLDELSEEIGENIEFDPVAWGCDFCEYPDAKNAADELGIEAESKDDAIEKLCDHTTVIEFDGGVIVQSF